MDRIGLHSLDQLLRQMGGLRSLEENLLGHLRRLDEALARGGAGPEPARSTPGSYERPSPVPSQEPLSDLFLALCESVADKYLEEKEPERAVNVVWEAFRARPRLVEYKALREWAMKIQGWAEWREKAWDHLNDRGGDTIAILLWEGHLEDAWNRALAEGASEAQWLELARRREQDHPEAAIRIYQDRVGRLLERPDAGSYHESVKWLRRLDSLYAHLGKGAEFEDILKKLRADQRRRPRFLEILTEAFGPEGKDDSGER